MNPDVTKIIDLLVSKKATYKALDLNVVEVMADDALVLDNWVFFVMKDDRLYIILNSRDLDLILGGAPVEKAPLLFPQIFDVPVTIGDNERMKKVMKGVFLSAHNVFPSIKRENRVRDMAI